MKLNEWKCDMDINDVYVKPEGILGDMIERFGLVYNPRTGCYDCDGDVNLYRYRKDLSNDEQEVFDKEFIRNGKMTIKFGEVKCNFLLPGDTYHLYKLTSLEGCPKTVGGVFSCAYNQLTSLEGCPKTVGGDFYCYANQLTLLKGCSESVGGDFNCGNNKLTSLEGCPQTVGGGFSCSNNQLTSLEGFPESVGGYFDCSSNQLTSLEGCPKTVGGYFDCNYNQLTSLKGCPESVGSFFYCKDNKVQFTEKYVRSVCDVERNIYV